MNVYAGDFNLSWRYKVPAGSDAWIDLNQTSHDIYVAYGAPYGSVVTTKRVEWVCNAAKGNSAEPNCVDAVFHSLDLDFRLGATPPNPLWLLLEEGGGHQGECGPLADFFILCNRMLGITATMTKGYIYPLQDGLGGRWSTDGIDNEWRMIVDPPHTGGWSHPHATYLVVEKLGWLDQHGGSNNYEAGVLYNDLYYCVGEGIYGSPTAAMLAMVDKTLWAYRSAPDPNLWGMCENPGPYPEYDW